MWLAVTPTPLKDRQFTLVWKIRKEKTNKITIIIVRLMDRMELPNQDKIRTLKEKETYKYFGILEAEPSNKWTRKLLETKPYQRNGL